MAAQQVPECVGLRVRQRRGGVRVVSRFCRRRSKLRHGRHRAAAHLLRKHRDGQFLPLTDLDPRGGPLAQPSPPLGQQQQPWQPENCDEDDLVDDTPNTLGWTSCDINGESCGSLDNVQNYMEYSYCGHMFTQGQKQRMRTAALSTTAQRNQLPPKPIWRRQAWQGPTTCAPCSS